MLAVFYNIADCGRHSLSEQLLLDQISNETAINTLSTIESLELNFHFDLYPTEFAFDELNNCNSPL